MVLSFIISSIELTALGLQMNTTDEKLRKDISVSQFYLSYANPFLLSSY
jgi:hypothetical protein